MKYVVVKTQRVVNLPNSEINLVLQDAGIIAPYVEVAKPMEPQTTWGVGEGSSGENDDVRITCMCATCGSKDAIFAHPERFTFWHCGVGEKVPPEIVKQFNDLKK